MPDFDAIVIAPKPGTALATVRVCGLTLAERARRVAVKAGAVRVLVADDEGPDTLAAWVDDAPADRELVVIDASDHVVHVPLVQTALTTELVLDPATQGFAGAARAHLPERAALARAAADPAALAAFAARRQGEHAPAAPHGELSRHPARTPAERKAAVHFLFGLIRKSQDSWLVRTINRKVSYPFTRLLLPINFLTPNKISIGVFILGAIGCLIATTPTYLAALIGAALLLFAGYLDGCDGEVARIRLESSKLGAWIDTIADEVTTILSVVCFGVHVYREHPTWDWLLPIVIGAGVLSFVSVTSIYWYLLTSGAGSGNSQDYPTTNPILNVLRYLIRREAINLSVFFLCLAGLVDVLYVLLAVGAVVSSSVLFTQQVQRVLARRALASGRATPEQGRAPS